MIKAQKQSWLTRGMVALALLLNIIIVITAYHNTDFLWVLLVSLSVLVIALCQAWQIHRLPANSSADKLFPHVEPTLFHRLPAPVYSNNIHPEDFKVMIGNSQCHMPYQLSLLSIDPVKLSHPECLSGNGLEEVGPAYIARLATGISRGFDLLPRAFVWQIGPDYSGCRAENGHFDSGAFKKIATAVQVKMIEIRLTPFRDPGHPADATAASGLPGRKGVSIFPGAGYTTFREAEGLIHFIENLRRLSGGKPVGIRLSIGDKKEFHQICYAIRKTQIIPDFIVVEGCFEQDSRLHPDPAFYTALPLYEALLFVSQTLQVNALDKEIKVIAAGKIISGFQVLKVLATGANAVFTGTPDFNNRDQDDSRKTLFQYQNVDIAALHHKLMMDTVQLVRDCGCGSLKSITLSKFLCGLDRPSSERLAQWHEPVLYQGSVHKIYPGKPMLLERESEKRKEKIALQ